MADCVISRNASFLQDLAWQPTIYSGSWKTFPKGFGVNLCLAKRNGRIRSFKQTHMWRTCSASAPHSSKMNVKSKRSASRRQFSVRRPCTRSKDATRNKTHGASSSLCSRCPDLQPLWPLSQEHPTNALFLTSFRRFWAFETIKEATMYSIRNKGRIRLIYVV